MLELEPINKEEFDRGIMFTVHVGGMGYVTAPGQLQRLRGLPSASKIAQKLPIDKRNTLWYLVYAQGK